MLQIIILQIAYIQSLTLEISHLFPKKPYLARYIGSKGVRKSFTITIETTSWNKNYPLFLGIFLLCFHPFMKFLIKGRVLAHPYP